MSLVSLQARRIVPRLSREFHSSTKLLNERDWSELLKRTYGYNLDSESTYHQSSDLKRRKVNFVAKTAVTSSGNLFGQSVFKDTLSKNSKIILNSCAETATVMNILLKNSSNEIPYHWKGVLNSIPTNSTELQQRIALHKQLFPPKYDDSDKLHVNIQQHMAKSVEFLIREGAFANYEDVFTRLTQNVTCDLSEVRGKLSPQHMLLTHYEAVVAAYLAQRFNEPYSKLKERMKNNTLNMRTLGSFKVLCDCLLDILQIKYYQIESVFHLMNANEITLLLLKSDPTVNKVFSISCINDLITTYPNLGTVDGDDLKKYAKLLDEAKLQGLYINLPVVQTLREDRFENVVETLEFFESHKLDLNSYKSSLFKFFRDPQLLSHIRTNKIHKDSASDVEDPTDVAYKCDVYIPATPKVMYHVLDYLDLDNLNKFLNCIKETRGSHITYNEETGVLDGIWPLRKYKDTSLSDRQHQVILFLKNKLDASGRKLFEEKDAFKNVTVEDAAYIVNILLNHGYSKKQIRLGTDIFKYDKRIIAKHLPCMKLIYHNYEEEVKKHPQVVNYLRCAIYKSQKMSGPKKV